MPSSPLPEAAAQVVGSVTRSFQVPLVVVNAEFEGFPFRPPSPLGGRTLFSASQLGTIRTQLLHYPIYATRTGVGALPSAWVARPYLMYRILGQAAPYGAPTLTGFQGLNSATPLTPQLLLPVGVPVEHVFTGCAFDLVWVEFDTTAGIAGSNQGADLVLATFTGSV